MAIPNINEIPPQTSLGFRIKGASIFYSCTAIMVNSDKIVISFPFYHTKPLEINTKVELRLQLTNRSILYGGTISELFTDSLEIKITSRQNHVEKRKYIRLYCEIKIKYMEEKVQEEVWHTTYSIDISPEGIKFYSPRFLKEDDILIFQFNIPDGYSSRFILVRGRIVHAKRITDYTSHNNSKSPSYRRFAVGVCFEGMSSSDNIDLIRYIYTIAKK